MDIREILRKKDAFLLHAKRHEVLNFIKKNPYFVKWDNELKVLFHELIVSILEHSSLYENEELRNLLKVYVWYNFDKFDIKFKMMLSKFNPDKRYQKDWKKFLKKVASQNVNTSKRKFLKWGVGAAAYAGASVASSAMASTKQNAELVIKGAQVVQEKLKENLRLFVDPIDVKFKQLITTSFEPRTDKDGTKRFHMGIDIAANKGTDVLASVDGIVEFAGANIYYKTLTPEGVKFFSKEKKEAGFRTLDKVVGFEGNQVRIWNREWGLKFYNFHLSQINVKAGQHVKVGQKIGEVGNTGRSYGKYGGYHLHFEVVVKEFSTFVKFLNSHRGVLNLFFMKNGKDVAQRNFYGYEVRKEKNLGEIIWKQSKKPQKIAINPNFIRKLFFNETFLASRDVKNKVA